MKLLKSKKLVLILIIFLFGIGLGIGFNISRNFNSATADSLQFDEQEATILAIKKVQPAVVSIIVYDWQENTIIELPSGKQTTEKQKFQAGSGTGFLISADGLIITNKHVVSAAEDKTAEYRIILNSGQQYYAQLIGKDPLKDLAILKIFDKNLPFVELGDSDQLQAGASVVAIGNSLGRYQNSVTKGIVSGLGRSLEAADNSGNSEYLDNVIQTDAEINLGNSGGPLVDLYGKVVGINVAKDLGGSSIGFAIPVNDARPVIKSVREIGRIVRPKLGLRYLMITPQMAVDKNLPRETGAVIMDESDGGPSVLPSSPAEKAGLQAGDIIFEINAIKLEGKNTLQAVIQKYKPGDKIGLKVQRSDKVMIKVVELEEFK
ncbi:hypothetical protein COV49_01555 [Candidatus Falkowbacteria bacterium CG11_big_fil_rev_8_21_14_0_20_39_10]|uniref:PDZ domain-containing protein n=1 Tax=Candidatus Falkowbacteria bacterium CG11_big_fil_rev_8_21_14_0_20_39_10 TaxID=1974570 RepID=A0A2M6K9K0_9BACT|nr:MAG: hypothetical protein COV49_01555 [Candidatus Falkowbacteria bacterium CG11_big_fil_rev_8_21_14_0_20_39_10]